MYEECKAALCAEERDTRHTNIHEPIQRGTILHRFFSFFCCNKKECTIGKLSSFVVPYAMILLSLHGCSEGRKASSPTPASFPLFHLFSIYYYIMTTFFQHDSRHGYTGGRCDETATCPIRVTWGPPKAALYPPRCSVSLAKTPGRVPLAFGK